MGPWTGRETKGPKKGNLAGEGVVPEVDLSSQDPHTLLGGALCIFFYKCNRVEGEVEGREGIGPIYRGLWSSGWELGAGAGRGALAEPSSSYVAAAWVLLPPRGEGPGSAQPHRSHSQQSKQQPWLLLPAGCAKWGEALG